MYGSVINRIMEESAQREPEVGMGATVTMWSDRLPATIIAVDRFKSGKRIGQVRAIRVQLDLYRRTDHNGQSELQTYEYSPNPKGGVLSFRPTKRGYHGVAGGLLVGVREAYRDPSF